MRVRMGFVGNSSSSSFLIYGIVLRRYCMDAVLDDKEWKGKGECSVAESLFHTEIGKQYTDICQCGPEGDEYAGLSWDEVGDDETGWEFKDRAHRQIKGLLSAIGVEMTLEEVEAACYTYQEAWMN